MANNENSQLAQLLKVEDNRHRFQLIVHSLTDDCWDLCHTGYPGSKLDRKTETCVANCVDRYIDASNFLLSRFGEQGEKLMDKSFNLTEDTGFKWN